MPTSKQRVSSQTILGIDPGFADMGYGVIRASGGTLEYVHCDTIKSRKQDSFGDRLMTLDQALEKIIKRYAPDMIAIEKLFFFNNQKTAIDVAQARGIALLAAARHRIPVVEYTPLEVKQSLTSFGQATKPQVAHMVATVLKVKTLPKQDDALDALAIAICARFRTRLKSNMLQA